MFSQKHLLNTTLKYFIPFEIHIEACTSFIQLMVTRGLDLTTGPRRWMEWPILGGVFCEQKVTGVTPTTCVRLVYFIHLEWPSKKTLLDGGLYFPVSFIFILIILKDL